jgi:DNA-directed RNA polymerase subunit M/transcription elongation factor TFIIS
MSDYPSDGWSLSEFWVPFRRMQHRLPISNSMPLFLQRLDEVIEMNPDTPSKWIQYLERDGYLDDLVPFQRYLADHHHPIELVFTVHPSLPDPSSTTPSPSPNSSPSTQGSTSTSTSTSMSTAVVTPSNGPTKHSISTANTVSQPTADSKHASNVPSLSTTSSSATPISMMELLESVISQEEARELSFVCPKCKQRGAMEMTNLSTRLGKDEPTTNFQFCKACGDKNKHG